ncbi:hypothetical protein BC332_12827 [Capsicum chinense]|nr:hypothetical protein BC332_12827 [Capsicum chinense]
MSFSPAVAVAFQSQRHTKDVVLAEKLVISDDSNQSESGASLPASPTNAQHPAARQPAAPAAPMLFLLNLGIDRSNGAILLADQPATSIGPPLPIVLPASSGQGLQISAQHMWRDRQVFTA